MWPRGTRKDEEDVRMFDPQGGGKVRGCVFVSARCYWCKFTFNLPGKGNDRGSRDFQVNKGLFRYPSERGRVFRACLFACAFVFQKQRDTVASKVWPPISISPCTCYERTSSKCNRLKKYTRMWISEREGRLAIWCAHIRLFARYRITPSRRLRNPT